MAENSFKEFILDQLASLDGVTCRAMFGGHGVYCRGAFFGIVFSGRVYFKTGDATRAKYIAEDMKPFQPSAKQQLKNYYEVPADVVESASLLCDWARESIAVADRARR